MDFLFILKYNVVLTTFVVLGLRMITDKGKIGHPLAVFVSGTFGEWWGKPILLCAPCMSSFWSIPCTLIIFLLFNDIIPLGGFFIMWILTAICSSFPAGLFWSIYQKLS